VCPALLTWHDMPIKVSRPTSKVGRDSTPDMGSCHYAQAHASWYGLNCDSPILKRIFFWAFKGVSSPYLKGFFGPFYFDPTIAPKYLWY
jgi:hypothetical protein